MTRVRYFQSFSALPESYASLLAQYAGQGLFYDRVWFEYLMLAHYCLVESNEMRLYAVEDAGTGRPLLIVPMCYTLVDNAAPKARTLVSLSHIENYSVLCLMFDQAVRNHEQVLVDLFKYFRKSTSDKNPSCFDVLRVWPVEAGSVLSGSICSALRSAGFLVQTYTNSFNHYENTAGVGYEEYFSRRSANLRYNVRRRIRSLAKNGAPEFNLYCDDNGLDQGINDYIAVSKSSWKPPGSMIAPELIALIRLAAEKDCLRLGILRVDDKAVAAQFWIISAGVANCIRLAYDEACKKKAVGVVLTNHMITHVLDHDHVDNIDFGYGDDAYKAGWMKDCRYYEGCIAFNPATMQGFYNGVKHIAGRPLKRVINTLIEKIHRARP